MGAVTTNAAALQGTKLNTSSLADAQVLTYDNATGTWMNKAASGGGGSQVILASESYLFESYDGLNTGGLTTGTGVVTFNSGNSNAMYLQAATTGDVAGLRGQRSASWLASNLPVTQYCLVAPAFAGGAGNGDAYIRAYTSANDPSTGTANQIGWHMTRTSGVVSGKSSTGDGTTEQAVTLSGYTPDLTHIRSNRLSMSYDGTTVSFYVDGVLKNSHTTNVPQRTTQETVYRPIMSITASTANSFTMYPGVYNLQYPMFS